MSRESSLRVSLIEGIWACIMFGLTGNYITPFALFIGATNFQIGLLNSIPQLFSSFIQLIADEITKLIKSRVKTISYFVFLHGISWIIISLIFIVPKPLQVGLFILLITLNSVFNALPSPAWSSLMSDTVEKTKYGEYFSWRNKIMGLVALISSFLAGFFLFIMPNKYIAFIILFFVSGICRIISAIYLAKMDDIPIEKSEKKDFSYYQFIKRLPESNFVKFVLYVALIDLTANIAGPFFSVYMLKDLSFSYSTYTIINSAGALSGILTLPFWGKFADKYGNARVIKVTGLIITILPVLWIFSKNPLYIIFVNILGGYIWAGYGLATGNYIFDAVSSEIRTRCVGYFNFTVGIFIFLGALTGGFLAKHLPGIVLDSSLLTLFLVSGILRFITNIFMLNSFKEVRQVEKIEDREMIYTLSGLKPLLTSLEDVIYKKKG